MWNMRATEGPGKAGAQGLFKPIGKGEGEVLLNKEINRSLSSTDCTMGYDTALLRGWFKKASKEYQVRDSLQEKVRGQDRS